MRAVKSHRKQEPQAERQGFGGRPRGLIADGRIVRECRLARGLTVEELGELCGLAVRTIQSAEHGGSLSASSARALSAALGVPMELLTQQSPHETAARLRVAGHAPALPPAPWLPRETELDRLCRMLSGAPPQIACLVGPSGVGKSALVCKAAELLKDRYHDGVLWIDAACTLRPGCAHKAQLGIARALRFDRLLPDRNAVGREAFDRAFRQLLLSKQCLLVVDDVPSAEHCRRFMPTDGIGAVIVTARRRHVAEALPQHHLLMVPRLTQEQSRVWLGQWLGNDQRLDDVAATNRLIALLGGMPRSLRIATMVLRRERHTSLAAYVERIGKHPSRHRVPEAPVPDDDSDCNASQTAALNRLRQELGPEAWEVLGRIGVFGAGPFSMSMAVESCGRNEAQVAPAIDALVDHFMLEELASEPGSEPRLVLDSQAAWCLREMRLEAGAQSSSG